jgi:hypothetical protein
MSCSVVERRANQGNLLTNREFEDTINRCENGDDRAPVIVAKRTENSSSWKFHE